MSISSPTFAIVASLATFAALFPAHTAVADGPSPDAPRPPAVPLVTHDPYFSIWSCADRLTDDVTRHWTNASHPLTSLVRIDGKTYRLMGPEPKEAPALPQVGLRVLPTRTIYDFEGGGAHVTLTFMTPALPDDLDTFARPVTYLTWDVRATDGRSHATSVYFDAGAQIAVNTPDQTVVGERGGANDLDWIRFGSADQPVLEKKGDDLRIDWGYLYAAAPRAGLRTSYGTAAEQAAAFTRDGSLAPSDDSAKPQPVEGDRPVAALVLDLGSVGSDSLSRYLILAYDDLYSINYFGRKLQPYWRRKGMGPAELLLRAAKDYPSLRRRCAKFDDDLMADLTKIGGGKYAQIGALAYRQGLAGNKLAADANGQPLLFPKENTSNGCIATVDVIYPMAPQFLVLSPTLAKASLAPVLSYAASARWKFPFAPHDLGTYPRATGQVYGGGERTEEDQMPVEESGNLILILAAISKADGNAKFASHWWPQVQRWAHYLEEKGFDPENQLCTDDFAGHLAHNANLSVKAIEALAAYGMMCGMRGEKAEAERYAKLAREMAGKWVQAADDGDHFRLAFDRAGTWSQKYNLVWDRLLGLDVFPSDVTRREIAFYRKSLNRYGLPLDNRKEYTKTDWTLWTATLTESDADFQALVSPVYDFLNATPNRVPFSDFYWTQDGRDAGMHARPVIGGVFIKMLAEPAVWKRWAGRDKGTKGDWAPLPAPPQVVPVVATSERAPVLWRFTVDTPASGWYEAAFDDSGWKQGAAGFGAKGTPNTVVGTDWQTADIWLRREIDLPSGSLSDLNLVAYHDEDAEVYLNGVLAARLGGYNTEYETFPIRSAALAALRPGKNVLAVHCHQTTGGQNIDVGLARIVEGK